MNPTSDNSLIQATPQTRPSLPLKLSRTVELLKSYRLSQISNRVWSIVWGKLNRGVRVVPEIPMHEVRDSAISDLGVLYRGREIQWAGQWSQEKQLDFESSAIHLLGEVRSFHDWECDEVKQASHLWRFHLHYHEFFLRALAWSIVGQENQQEKAALVEKYLSDWLNHHRLDKRPACGDAWHPYVISRRIPVWCQLYASKSLSPKLKEDLLQEIVRHARCLEVNLEWDLCGNHLLENFRALGYVACLVSGAWSDGLKKKLFTWLKAQVQRQVLATGEHYERSPMYHCQVTGIFLELAHLFECVDSSIGKFCADTADGMLGFLDRVTHPDGEVPLFNDAVFEEAPSVQTLCSWRKSLKTARPGSDQGESKFRNDYWVQGNQEERLIVDCGPVAAADLPAHGHCDLGNFEWSHDGLRWITDSGVRDYSGGAEHFFCRNSLAHNVMTIDRKSCCDIWGKFRMGRRATIQGHRSGHSKCCEFVWLEFWHNGYFKNLVPKLHRIFVYHRSGAFWVVDFAESKSGSISDRIGYLHFAPEVSVLNVSGNEISLAQSEAEVKCFFTGVDGVSVREGLYCFEFGQAAERTSIEYTQHGKSVPLVCEIRPSNCEGAPRLEVCSDQKQHKVQVADLAWQFPAQGSVT